MKTRTFITFALIISGIAGATTAGAEQNNPLHPSYFWGKTKLESLAYSDAGKTAVAITNPLHPGYFAAKAGPTTFVDAVASIRYAYVDTRNPLHPSYRRN